MPISVKEVVKTAAGLIGADDLAKEADGVPRSEGLLLLIRCFDLVENEIALDYFPLKRRERFAPSEGKIEYARFSKPPVGILSVTDGSGLLPFELFPDHIGLRAQGEVDVTYQYAPVAKTIEEESDLAGRVSVRMLAYGVAAEYLLATARYTEASSFDRKYREALAAANMTRRRIALRARRWQ